MDKPASGLSICQGCQWQNWGTKCRHRYRLERRDSLHFQCMVYAFQGTFTHLALCLDYSTFKLCFLWPLFALESSSIIFFLSPSSTLIIAFDYSSDHCGWNTQTWQRQQPGMLWATIMATPTLQGLKQWKPLTAPTLYPRQTQPWYSARWLLLGPKGSWLQKKRSMTLSFG